MGTVGTFWALQFSQHFPFCTLYSPASGRFRWILKWSQRVKTVRVNRIMSDIESYFPSCFVCSFIGTRQYLSFHTNVNKCPVPETAPSNHGSRQRIRASLTTYGRLSAALSNWERHSLFSVGLDPREVFILKDNKGLTVVLSIIWW